jgi:hypothetical protein
MTIILALEWPALQIHLKNVLKLRSFHLSTEIILVTATVQVCVFKRSLTKLNLPLRIKFQQRKLVTLKIPQSAYLMMRLKIPDHVILPCSRLYTLTSKASDTTSRQMAK